MTRADQVPPYYSQISDQHGQMRFRNFDDKSTFDEYAAKVESASSRNFVIDFGPKEACAAFDVDQSEINGLLASEVRNGSVCSAMIRLTVLPRDLRHCQRDGCKCTGSNSTLGWGLTTISQSNIWAPELQKDLVKVNFPAISSYRSLLTVN